MGVCCGKDDKKPKLYAVPPAQEQPTVKKPNPPQDPLATGNPAQAGHDKTVITTSYLNELGGGHIYGVPNAPIQILDKKDKIPQENNHQNYPVPPQNPKIIPDPNRMPAVDDRNRNIHPSIPDSHSLPNESPQLTKVIVSPREGGNAHLAKGQLDVVVEKPEEQKTISIISIRNEVVNLLQKPTIIELKQVPDTLPAINKPHFDSITSKMILLNPSTLNIKLPGDRLTYVNSIRALPWTDPNTFDFISANQLYTAKLSTDSAIAGIEQPLGNLLLIRWTYLV